MKKYKQVEEKILAKKKKYENEICPGTAAKKNNIGCNDCYTQSEKSQNPKDNVNAEKIFKKICLPKKDKKSLCK